MSALSESSDENNADSKDEEFKIDDCRNEIESDDSLSDFHQCNRNAIREENGGRRFVCIKYPGNVVNYEKAVETLGGLATISRAINTPNRRLELRFRTQDGYCKPTCGDRYATNGFLLRVRVKKPRIKEEESDNKTTEIESNTATTAKFPSNDGNSSNFAAGGWKNVGGEEKMATEYGKNSTELEKEKEVKDIEIKDGDEKMADLVNRVEKFDIKNSQDGNFSGFVSSETANNNNSNNNNENITPTFDKNKYEDLSEDRNYQLPKLKILGRIESEFRFNSLCDFQYLPLSKPSPSSENLSCIYHQIYPHNIPPNSWLKNHVPYFLPPAAFSRMDTIQKFAPKTELNLNSDTIIGKSRKRKSGFSNFIYFNTPEVPKKPPIGIETAMKVKFILRAHFQKIREVFEERPIWSKNAIMYKTRFSTERLKVLLPAVAYYCVTGPWKIMWVKLGYDPRKDVAARKYQTLDYRLKAMHGLGSTVKCKRSYSEFTLPYKSTPPAKQTIIQNPGSSQENAAKKEQEMNENVYIYREGTVPPSRQMFYQYCDVLVDEIQEMLSKLPDPPAGTKCHEKRGWLPNGFDAQCREIINKQVRAVLRKRMNIPEDHPTTLPKKKRSREVNRKTTNRAKLKTKRKKVVDQEVENNK